MKLLRRRVRFPLLAILPLATSLLLWSASLDGPFPGPSLGPPHALAEAPTDPPLPNDPLYRELQWNMRKIHADEAWDITTGSSDVVVALLDTGVDSSHPDLEGKLVPGYDFLNDDPDPADDSGHGTHNAGIIGALSNNGTGVAGIAWRARIMPIKVLNSSGFGPDLAIANGIMYAADHGAKIINMSFGRPNSARVLASAIRYAYDRGALLVAAAGNTANMDNATIYPAAYEQVLAVGATDEMDQVANFSQNDPYVSVSAPGVGITSTFWRGAGYGSYMSANGTSTAAAHVSGLAALLWSVNPSLTNWQVKQILQETADFLGPGGGDKYYGTGRINAYRAVLAARPAAPPHAPAAPAPTPEPLAAPGDLPRSTWYFAEGSTARPFNLWLFLQNPNNTPATARVSYRKRDGSQQQQEVALSPVSRQSIFVNEIVPNAEVSMKVESDSLLLAERAIYSGGDGEDSLGASEPSNQWFMAEGSTQGEFETRIVLQNPQEVPANVLLAFLTSKGERKEISVAIPPNSRRRVGVNQILPGEEFSTIVSSDRAIIAERSMYFGQGGVQGGGAASQLARNWYLAEGRVGDDYDGWLLVLNPGESAANLKVTFMREDGSNQVVYYAVHPASRASIYVNPLVHPGRFGAQVESDQPIVVERSTYFGGGRGGANAVGAPRLARQWYLPEGSTRAPFAEEIAILNPGEHTANLVVTFMKNEGGAVTGYFAAAPTSRLTLNVNDLMPDSEISVEVVSDTPIAVERSMYFANGRGGTTSFGIPR